MLELRRLGLLRELSERGTVAAVADALQYTPSAVSQQLAVLEREAGVPLLAKAGRTLRLTDAALAMGDLDLVLADEWGPQPRSLPDGVVRHGLPGDPVRVVLPAAHPLAAEHPEAVPLAALAGEAWA